MLPSMSYAQPSDAELMALANEESDPSVFASFLSVSEVPPADDPVPAAATTTAATTVAVAAEEEPIVMAMGRKETPTSLIGLVLKDHPENGVIINSITPTSIFQASKLKKGMKIISINDTDCQFLDKQAAATILKDYSGTVTIWAATDLWQEERTGTSSSSLTNDNSSNAAAVPPLAATTCAATSTSSSASTKRKSSLVELTLPFPPPPEHNDHAVLPDAPSFPVVDLPDPTPTTTTAITATARRTSETAPPLVDKPETAMPKPKPVKPHKADYDDEEDEGYMSRKMFPKVSLRVVRMNQPFSKKGRWTKREHDLFLQGMERFGNGQWIQIANLVQTRSNDQVRTHAQKYFDTLQKEFNAPETADLMELHERKKKLLLQDKRNKKKAKKLQKRLTQETITDSFVLGDRVHVKWNEQEIYAGTITNLQPGKLYVKYDDDQEGWEKIEDCSLLHSKAAGQPNNSDTNNMEDYSWRVAYMQLQDYKKKHGHANPPPKNQLSTWLHHQRDIYNRQVKQQNGSKHNSLVSLTQRQINLLRAVGCSGFGHYDDDDDASQPPQAEDEEEEEEVDDDKSSNYDVLRNVLLQEIAMGRIAGPPTYKQIWPHKDNDDNDSNADICGLPTDIADDDKVPVDICADRQVRKAEQQPQEQQTLSSDSEESFTPRFDHWGLPKTAKRERKPSAKVRQLQELQEQEERQKQQKQKRAKRQKVLVLEPTAEQVPAELRHKGGWLKPVVVTPEQQIKKQKAPKKRTLSLSPSLARKTPKKKRRTNDPTGTAGILRTTSTEINAMLEEHEVRTQMMKKRNYKPVAKQAVPGCGRGNKQFTFNDRVLQLAAYKEKHGHVAIPTVRRDPYYRLGVWVAAMRSLHKKGDLKRDRLRKLQDLGCVGFGGSAGAPEEEEEGGGGY